MLKNLIGGLIMVVFVIGGALAADALKPEPKRKSLQDIAASTEIDPLGNVAGEEEAKEPQEKKKKKKDESYGEEGEGGVKVGSSNYYKFSRQFIVPVVNGDNLQSLVILDLNLEIEPGVAEQAYALEPKLRDSLMTELLALSNEGRFETRLTDPTNYAEIRARLLVAALKIMPDGVKEVLILDIARQDQ